MNSLKTFLKTFYLNDTHFSDIVSFVREAGYDDPESEIMRTLLEINTDLIKEEAFKRGIIM
jgi:hypothetical protein